MVWLAVGSYYLLKSPQNYTTLIRKTFMFFFGWGGGSSAIRRFEDDIASCL